MSAKGVLSTQSLCLGRQRSREVLNTDALIPGKEVDPYGSYPPQLITRLPDVRGEKTGEIESELYPCRVSVGALSPFANRSRRARKQLGISWQPHRGPVSQFPCQGKILGSAGCHIDGNWLLHWATKPL